MSNRRLIQIIAVVLTVIICLRCVPVTDVFAKTTKELLEEAEQQHQETAGQINEKKNTIDNLSNERSGLQNELNKLNAQLSEVSNNLEKLEKQIALKEKQIELTEADLEEAILIEETQYNAMKKRIKFMYEKRDTMYTDMLFSSANYSDIINRNDYIELLAEYDRNQLEEFKATRAAVEEAKAKLEEEKRELDAYHEEVTAEQKKVSGYVSQTAGSISQYNNQIKSVEAEADALAAQHAKEEQNIAELKKKLAEEIAMSKLAAQSSWRDISEVSFEEGDRMLLANLIYCEAGNQPYAGQLAVGAVVINRVLSSVYPNTVVGVIYQNKQFSPVGDGHLALALASDKATQACYKAADEAMSGQTNVGTCVYFRTPIEGLTGIQIGAHIFY